MFSTLLYMFVNSLIIVGLFYCFGKEQIFGKLGLWVTSKIGPFWSRPLFSCPVCMSSLWGTTFFFLKEIGPIQDWPLYCLALAGLLTIYVQSGLVKIWMV